MTIQEINAKLTSSEYDFLRTHPKLGDNIILLGLGGSRAYNTSTPTSDWDLRGIATNSPKEILIGTDFGQVVERTTDTVVYSFNKMLKLLADCNPNTILFRKNIMCV